MIRILKKNHSAVRSCPIVGHLSRFRRAEDGALVIFSLFLFLIILFVGALGVDLMRFERERAKLQSTLDRAVLAAADIDQSLDPSFVVNEYFTKSGFPDSVTSVTVSEGLGFRSVSATARKQVSTHLLHMMGVDTLTAPAAGAAEERVDNVEISLVLDISGSMNSNSRMTNLHRAGQEFIDAVFANAAENKISVSLVPYNGQVNIGPDLITKYNVQQRHDDNYCVDLPSSVYSSLSLPRTHPMLQHVMADTFNKSVYTWDHSLAARTGYYNSVNDMPYSTNNRWCDPNPANRVRVHSSNTTVLKNAIRDLQAVGATSIDAGMRWGTALLDPSSRSVVSELVAENKVVGAFNGRPLDYSNPDVLKVVVLMTDGEHFPNEFINDGYRWGQSPIFFDPASNRHSIFHAHVSGTNKFYAPHDNSWRQVPWGGTVTQSCSGSWWNRVCTNILSNGTAVQLDWPQVWKQVKTSWVAEQLYARPLNQNANAWWNNIRTREGQLNWSTGVHQAHGMNTRLLNLCNLAKQQGIVVYTVAFEAPTAARNLLSSCASSSNHAFNVNGLEISSAFSSIATSIRKLRLTQ